MPETNYAKCPCCGFATIYKGNEPPQYTDSELLTRLRQFLSEFYIIHSPVAHKARLLRQEIDVILLTR